jgi:hypothetical protein
MVPNSSTTFQENYKIGKNVKTSGQIGEINISPYKLKTAEFILPPHSATWGVPSGGTRKNVDM